MHIWELALATAIHQKWIVKPWCAESVTKNDYTQNDSSKRFWTSKNDNTKYHYYHNNKLKNRSDEKYSDKNILNANCNLIDSYKNIQVVMYIAGPILKR